MYLYTLLFLTITTDRMLARVISSACPGVCTCVGTTARCDVTHNTLSTVLRTLPRNLTELDLSHNRLTRLKKGTFRRFHKLEFLHVQGNGDKFRIDNDILHDTPALLKVHLDGNPTITSLQFLRTVKKLREVLVNSEKDCSLCNYSLTPSKERCRFPRYCADPRNSPFGSDNCACVLCVSPKSRMVSPNCSQDHHLLASRLTGNSNAVRIALWLISSLALVSNLALIVSRCYTHTLRQKPLSIFIAGIALSNLFITTSVMVLLAADMNQSPQRAGLLGDGHWSQYICGPVYFMKHFGIYSLVFLLTFVVMERFIKLGYHRCFASHITVRRSVLYVCEAWVLSFLCIIMPWTRVTKWHRMCTASHETNFAQVMYFISGILVIALCLVAAVLVAILFRRQTLVNKLQTRTSSRWDLGLSVVTVLTLLLIGIPHSILLIGPFAGATSPETGVEIVTILLMILCIFCPILLARYCPTMTCLSDSFCSSSISCSCSKCKLGHYYPTKYSMNSLRPPKSCITLSSCQESCTTKKYSTTITSTASVERMSQDSLTELNTWTSQTTKTKSWGEGGETRSEAPAPANDQFCEIDPRASHDSNENLGNFSTILVDRAQCSQTETWVESCDYDDLNKIKPPDWSQAPQPSHIFSELEITPCTLRNENLKSCSALCLEHAQSCSTKCWIERCDYDDLKKINNAPQASKNNGLLEENIKPRALTWSDENDGTLTTVSVEVTAAAECVSESSQHTSSLLEAIHEHAILEAVIPVEPARDKRVDAELQKASETGKKTNRLSSFMELIHRTFTSRRQRSKSLPENPNIQVNKVERSQSMSFADGTLDQVTMVTSNEPSHDSVFVDVKTPGTSTAQDMSEEKLASFLILPPPKSARKNIFSPRKTKASSVSSPTNARKSSIADRIAKSFFLARSKSPSTDEPAKTITLEEGDILTELPVMRRNKLRTKPRDATVRDSTASNGSTTTRYSMEWDPIGSVEGYADREVLPPYPPVSLKNPGVPRFPQMLPVTQAPVRYSSGTLPERFSSYSLDWDPTSVQMRNSMISRDSLSLAYPSEDDVSIYDEGIEGDVEGCTRI